MYKEYDGDGVETPITYEVKESFKGEVRQAILERFCFDTALEDEYEMSTDDGEATIITRDWILPFERDQLNIISHYADDNFFVDLTVDGLEKILNSHRLTEVA